MVLVLALLGAAFAEQPAINGVPGSLTWQNAPLAWRVEHGGDLSIRSGRKPTGSLTRLTARFTTRRLCSSLCLQMTMSSAQS
jgi:hypothetical protein